MCDERDRDRDDRNDRGAPALQEDDDDEHDQQDRFHQRVLNGLDGGGDVFGRVVRNGPADAGREILLDCLHHIEQGLLGFQRVRARRLDDGETDTAFAAEIATDRIIL